MEKHTPIHLRPMVKFERSGPPAEYHQEIRFAVVMYGGVSLAIYINGVAQELLRLVRATAPGAVDDQGVVRTLLPDSELSPVERIYRELGGLLDGSSRADSPAPADDVVRTRFIVDVISGTSAGGINGIFLANALARHRDMEQLKTLWITEGEIDKLLNDAESVGDLDGRLPVPKRPKSLLNSRRMYIKLLEALQGMRSFLPAPLNGESRLVDELDLFVTATDLRGLLVKLRLADRIVYERRFRNVFHFLHATEHGTGEPRNDFTTENEPFLAFAARCTSSFPFAFEPMTLDQGTALLGSVANLPATQRAQADVWPGFYRDYRPSAMGRNDDPCPMPFQQRPFGDGGYLDNKPFGYAISALRNRRTDLPVRRKLFYVEPSPEHPELDQDVIVPPDAIENLLLAASKLPRQETIREDLERVLERNRQIESVKRALRSASLDFRLPREDPGVDGGQNAWQKKWLRDVMDEPPAPALPAYGGGYGAYHRLKVSEVTTEMADSIARLVGLEEGSDEATALRFLVSAWRQWRFQAAPRADREVEPENQFLMSYDLSYRLRRLTFVQHQLEAFVLDSPHASDVLKVTEDPGLFDAATLASGVRPLVWSEQSEVQRERVKRELRRVGAKLAGVQIALRRAGRDLRNPGGQGALRADITSLGIGWNEIKAILESPDSANRTRLARGFLGLDPEGTKFVGDPRHFEAMKRITDTIARELRVAFESASGEVGAILHGKDDARSEDLLARVRHNLWHQYRRFDYIDMLLFPMMAGTDLGELCEVDVLRISPEDATRLIRERAPGTHLLQRSKLAGTRLGHFGAFLDPIWRRSDILWGRLDAAERIFAACAPPGTFPPDADAPEHEENESTPATVAVRIRSLLRKLQAAIITEEIVPLGAVEGRKVFVEALLHSRSGQPEPEALDRLLDRILPYLTEDSEIARILHRSDVRDVYMRRSAENRELDREKQVRLVARGSEVLGRMLDDLANTYVWIRKSVVGVLIHSGRVLNGLVEIASPRSVWELFGVYWLNLLYALEVVIVLGGQFLLPTHDVRNFGLELFLITFGIDVSTRFVGLYLARRSYAKAVGILFGLLAGAIFLVGLGRSRELLLAGRDWLDRNDRGLELVLVLLAAVGVVVASRWIDEGIQELAAKGRAKAEAGKTKEKSAPRAKFVARAGGLRSAPDESSPVAPPGHRS